jgi:hypothetical protein
MNFVFLKNKYCISQPSYCAWNKKDFPAIKNEI